MLTPAGKTELYSAVHDIQSINSSPDDDNFDILDLKPIGESCMHMLLNPSLGIAPFCPTHLSACHLKIVS